MVEEHDVVLRGASFAAPFAENGEAPILLQRTDEDPIGVLLEKLASEKGREELAQSLAQDRDEKGNLKLYQPVHRTWHLVLLEAACDAPGQPRLDPARIESAGLVIRRLRETEEKKEKKTILEGWRRSDRKLRGWIRFGPGEERLDPDPKKRRPARSSGHPEIDRRLLLREPYEPLEESVSPLFVAPPDVCKSAGRTLLYGLVPVTSSERSEDPEGVGDLDEGRFREAIEGNLSVLLKGEEQRRNGSQGYSWLGQTLTSASAAGNGDLGKDLKTLIACLEQLEVQLEAFQQGSEMLERLNQVLLPYDSGPRPAGEVLAEAAGVFLSNTRTSVLMPDAWPQFKSEQRKDILDAAVLILRKRLLLLTAGEGRFDSSLGKYVLQAFLRVKSHHPGCPPKLVWARKPSPPSPIQSFTIVPWYEAGALPPHQVALPDVTQRDALRKLKPNVAFILPAGLKKMLDGANLTDLTQGKHSGGPGLDLGWICGFNIPLITICAFFVLNIFLQLLNIVFFWLPFIKICIPFPRKSNG